METFATRFARRSRGPQERRGRAADVELGAVAGRHDLDRVARDTEAGIAGRVPYALRKRIEVVVRARAADGESPRAVTRQYEQLRDAPLGKPPLALVAAEEHRRGQRDACAARGCGEHLRRHGRRGDRDGKRNRLGRAVERAERPHHEPRGRFVLKAAAGLFLDDLDTQAPADERRARRLAVRRHLDLLESELERGVGDGDPGEDLCSEEARVDPSEPADRAEAASLATGGRDRAAPVRLDPELVRRE